MKSIITETLTKINKNDGSEFDNLGYWREQKAFDKFTEKEFDTLIVKAIDVFEKNNGSIINTALIDEFGLNGNQATILNIIIENISDYEAEDIDDCEIDEYGLTAYCGTTNHTVKKQIYDLELAPLQSKSTMILRNYDEVCKLGFIIPFAQKDEFKEALYSIKDYKTGWDIGRKFWYIELPKISTSSYKEIAIIVANLIYKLSNKLPDFRIDLQFPDNKRDVVFNKINTAFQALQNPTVQRLNNSLSIPEDEEIEETPNKIEIEVKEDPDVIISVVKENFKIVLEKDGFDLLPRVKFLIDRRFDWDKKAWYAPISESNINSLKKMKKECGDYVYSLSHKASSFLD
jgi:hypothetical protein